MHKNKVLLCILDGFALGTDNPKNAVKNAQIDFINKLLLERPWSYLETSGLAVGLPEGQMGNSEVGHMSIGSGRIVLQDLPRIDLAIENNEIIDYPAIQQLCEALKDTDKSCHLLGLFSDGGVHSHINHMFHLAEIISAAGVKVKIHGFLDGRDTAQKSAIKYLELFSDRFKNNSNVTIASLMGRYYGMDRDHRWDRITKAYNAIIAGEGSVVPDFMVAIEKSYAQKEYDEFVKPMINSNYKGAQNGDAIIMSNFRSDRVRQLLTSLLDNNFAGFSRQKIVNFSHKIGMVEYSNYLSKFMEALFQAIKIENTLPDIISQRKLSQLRIAETEKYAHVTFFFSGGKEQLLEGEERVLIPSPQISTYDLQPEMSAFNLTDRLIEEIEKKKFDLIVVNFANCDMVGHSGNFEATKKAVKVIDQCLQELVPVALKVNYNILITADHGNAEEMEIKGNPHTSHTTNPVPLILVSEKYNKSSVSLDNGRLCDVAPTILEIMGIEKPKEMSGISLVRGV